MRGISLFVAVAVLMLGLAACSHVEEFYADRCADWGGSWSASDGCQGM